MKYLNMSFTGFKLNIIDMIIWQQIDNGIWMPNNIKEVYSRGIETKTNFKFRKLRFDGKYKKIKNIHKNAPREEINIFLLFLDKKLNFIDQ